MFDFIRTVKTSTRFLVCWKHHIRWVVDVISTYSNNLARIAIAAMFAKRIILLVIWHWLSIIVMQPIRQIFKATLLQLSPTWRKVNACFGRFFLYSSKMTNTFFCRLVPMRRNMSPPSSKVFSKASVAYEFAKRKIDAAFATLNARYKGFEQSPARHPMYRKEWLIFYLRRASELLARRIKFDFTVATEMRSPI